MQPKLSGTYATTRVDRHKGGLWFYSNQHHGKAMQDKLKELNAGVIRLYLWIAWLKQFQADHGHCKGMVTVKVCRPAFLQVYFVTLVSELFYNYQTFYR